MKGKWMSIMLSLALVAVIFVVVPGAAFAADSDIVISEVLFNATCLGTADATCGTTGVEDRFEWVEIKNKGTSAVSLNGWQICDLGGTPGCDALPNQTIQPGEYWIIAYNTTALQTEFNQYSPTKSVDGSRTISLNSNIGGNGLRNTSAEGVYLVNASSQDVTCVSFGAANTLCSTRTTLGSKTDTSFTTGNGQSITNIEGTWYKHGPSDATQQASPYGRNTNTSGTTAITLRALTAAAPLTPWAAALPALGLVAAAGAGVARARRPRS